jgi:tight adherence protein C
MDAVEFAALRWLLVMGACGLAGGVVVSRAWDLLGNFLGFAILAFAWWGPQIWLDWQVDSRQRELELALPNLLDRLTLCLEAGLSFELALERTSPRFPGLLGDDLRRLVRQLARGYRRSDALDDLTRRNASSDLRAFVAAVKQADRLGTSLARTLRLQTNLLRSRRRRRAQQASQRLPILIIFPLVFFFLPALMIIYLAPPILHLLSVR